jgi:hypothetical protein
MEVPHGVEKRYKTDFNAEGGPLALMEESRYPWVGRELGIEVCVSVMVVSKRE